jgi:D-tagatose-bisphosphate aldolase class II non-catalytic subunit
LKERSPLRQIIASSRAGQHAGIPSFCTAHPETLRAIFRAYRGTSDAILIEATCNQVNQDGGYTGMKPADFRLSVHNLAREAKIETDRIILGGDHLGPNPWKGLSSRDAMAKACDLVALYVEAGFTKIHLDASMACADDYMLSEAEMAARAATLCAAAEKSADGAELLYVIGTEVPVPGGETETLKGLEVTKADAALQTFELHRAAFEKSGLEAAFERVIGIVVQPGVDFGNSQIFAFDKEKAAGLAACVQQIPDAVFEAHSTDYQTARALNELVSASFAILKVGPELTAAYREAVVAMACIEERLALPVKSDIMAVIAKVMNDDPKYWRGYIEDDDRTELSKIFGLSDRIRYYWPNAEIQAALKMLCFNIDRASDEIGLIAQFASLPEQRALPLSQEIIQARVGAVVRKYQAAC